MEFDTNVAVGGKIVRASMDGTGISILFDNTTVTRPNALALDYTTESLYWHDFFTRTITKLRIDNMNQNYQVIQSFPQIDTAILSIDFFDGHLYWTEIFEDQIFRVTPNGSVQLLRTFVGDPVAIHVVDSSRQPAGQSM